MTRLSPRLQLLLEQALAFFVLAVLVFYTYNFFAVAPYAGFAWYAISGKLLGIFAPSALQPGDIIIQIDSIPAAKFLEDARQTVFDNAQPGDKIPILIERDGQELAISYEFPGYTRNEFLHRLGSQWWLAFIFWGAGQMTLLGLRPKDTRWRLFVAFNLLTAICIATSTVSRWHLWESSVVLRMGMWMSMPVYWHLHWVVPKPFASLPRVIWPAAYLLGAALALAEFFHLTIHNFYTIGFIAAVAGSLILFLIRLIFKPDQRLQVGLLLLVSALALLPSAITVASRNFSSASRYTLFFLPLLPLAYLYAAYRRQFSGLEIRGNRLISLYLFFLLLAAVMMVLVPLADDALNVPANTLFISVLINLLIAAIAIFGFRPFQQFVERRLLGISMSATDLLEHYSAQIIVSPDMANLARLIRTEIYPTFLVRQAALLRYDDQRLEVMDMIGVSPEMIPGAAELPRLLAESGRYRFPAEPGQPYPWVHLILPLVISQKPVGLWLLGRRDPDDFYSREEIAILQALANQTAIALTHIIQTERLYALYRVNIDQRETERASLARELHDNVLNQLAILKMEFDQHTLAPHTLQRWDGIVVSLREVVAGLRSAMLNYGLHLALSALVDDLNDRAEHGPAILLDLSQSDTRYDLQMEQHLYRIVQQACDNALRHARAQTIRVYGQLEPDYIELLVEDDGMGFETSAPLDIAGLLAGKHYGMAGMHERAALINAQMKIYSSPGRGTRVQITWSRNDHHRPAA
jgi:signal transduction histidine kinase